MRSYSLLQRVARINAVTRPALGGAHKWCLVGGSLPASSRDLPWRAEWTRFFQVCPYPAPQRLLHCPFPGAPLPQLAEVHTWRNLGRSERAAGARARPATHARCGCRPEQCLLVTFHLVRRPAARGNSRADAEPCAPARSSLWAPAGVQSAYFSVVSVTL